MKFAIFTTVMLCSCLVYTQEYLDLLTIGTGTTPPIGFTNSPQKTQIASLEANLLLPIPLSKKTALMTGISGFTNSFTLAPEGPEVSIYTYAFQVGINQNYKDGWSSTHLLFPRITSAFDQDRSSLQWGMANVIQHAINKHSKWGVGLYVNTEEQGVMVVPLLSLYKRSESGFWEFNALLPAKAELTMRLDKRLRTGFGFEGLGNSFAVNLVEYGSSYIQRGSMEFSSYLQYPITKGILVNLRGGYALFRRFRVFDADDTVKFSIMNIFLKDPRLQLNESLKDGPFINLRLVYRFHLPVNN